MNLGPLGEEYLGIYEMRYRQLISDIGDNGIVLIISILIFLLGIFGHIYYSQTSNKLALVGTLTKVGLILV